MISEKIQQALNEQINAELYSAYLYLSMNAYFESENLQGFANWMRIQAQEELTHAMKIYDFLNDRGGTVTLKTINQPPTEWDSPFKVFKDTYEHEQKVTGLINNLVNLANQEKDHATNSFLQWFVTEQVEEENNARDIVSKIKLIEKSPQAMFMMDKDMAQRIFTPPLTKGEQ